MVFGVMAAGTLITVEDVQQSEFGVVTMVQFAADVPADANLAAFTIEVTFDETVATFAADAFTDDDSPFSLTCNPGESSVICSGFQVNGFTSQIVNLFSLPFRCIEAGTLLFSAETLNIIAFTDQNGTAIDTMFDNGSLRCLAPTATVTATLPPTDTPSPSLTLTASPPVTTQMPPANTVVPTMTVATPITLTPISTAASPTATATSTPNPTDNTPITNTVGTINGVIFNDDNQNGLYEPNLGELGLDGVSITLLSETGVMWVMDTVGSGIYQFDNLPTGQTYTVNVGIVTLPVGTTAHPTRDVDSISGVAISVALPTPSDSSTTVTLPIFVTESFGFIPTEPTSVTFTNYTTSLKSINAIQIRFTLMLTLTILGIIRDAKRCPSSCQTG